MHRGRFLPIRRAIASAASYKARRSGAYGDAARGLTFRGDAERDPLARRLDPAPRLSQADYWRAVRTFSGGATPALVRNGLMSMPPRRVKRASTVSASQPQRAARSTKIRSTQCS